MHIHIPVIDWLPVVGGPLVAASLFIAALARAAYKTRLPKGQSIAAIAGFACFVAVWFVAYAFLAAKGAFNFGSAVPVLPIALLLPLFVAVVAFQATPALRAIVESVPQEQLIGIQIIRLMGFAFLLLLAQSLLPAVFALPAGLGDMLVGFEAIFVAGLYARRASSAPMMGLIFNLTGFADFAVGLAIGFLASTAPLRLIHVIPSTDLVAALPLALVPTFGIPLFLVLHVLSLRRVIAELKSTTRTVVA
ncbi:MAG TPA: hypothetical protein VKT72_11860 [Candidatus Baltobacteraceae bacterium]|nr:hypothetical protein [Candidatus Baltobacteraceae bacterium]